MSDKVRLLLWEECDRACEGCCNKDWDLGALPVYDRNSHHDVVMLTGGEPMLHREKLIAIAKELKPRVNCLVLYTACTVGLEDIADLFDGLTVTLHEQKDAEQFKKFDRNLLFFDGSLRLNVFAGVEFEASPRWVVKKDIEWIKECPLPSDEVFVRW